MNKGAIKTFAIWARNKLMSDVANNAYLIGITKDEIKKPLSQSTDDMQYFDIGSSTPYSLPKAGIILRNKLVSALEMEAKQSNYETAYRNLLEHTASTWFNRLCAIRFMEVNDYFNDGLRVLSSLEEGKKDSDLMASPFDSDLEFTEPERQQIVDWKLDNESEKLFGFLLQKKCEEISGYLPGLFATKEEPSALLVNFSIADAEGVVQHLVNDIEEEDWKEQVQIIGWLYQFYNTEFKDETNALLKKKGQVLTKERIPSVTQLFTPEWIVKYMVENSLGRIWNDGHPNEELKSKWKYYLEEAEQDSEVLARLVEIRKEYAILAPKDLTFIDPCMGSGHILCYAFDVLMQIYESQGYTSRDSVRSILENNLYGLDIDERAYQLAYFSIMMKARQYDHGAFRRDYVPQLYAFEESNGVAENQMEIFGIDLSDIERNIAVEQMKKLISVFKDAKESGSILKVESMDWNLLRRFIESVDAYGRLDLMTMDLSSLTRKLDGLIKIGEILSQKYWVTCTNPPYMVPTAVQRKIVDKYYKDEKADLGVVFVKRTQELTIDRGYQAMITMHSWMFLSTFERFRTEFLSKTLLNMAHLGTRAFEEIGGEVVQTTAFVRIIDNLESYKGAYSRLVDYNNQNEKEEHYLKHDSVIYNDQTKYKYMPGSPILYWVSDEFIDNYRRPRIKDYAEVITGMTIGDNKKYLRLWFEVDKKTIMLYDNDMMHFTPPYKWIPYSKGGSRRNWYGNYDYIVNWTQREHFNRSKTTLQHLYLKEAITWPFITTGDFSARLLPNGSLWDVAGSPCFFSNLEEEKYTLGMLCSKVANCILRTVNPTINIQAIDIANIPLIIESNKLEEINAIVDSCLELSKFDWDSFETSWDYLRHPLVSLGLNDDKEENLARHYSFFEKKCSDSFNQLKMNEERLNRIFIDIYGLENELQPEVDEAEITIRRADLKRDMKNLISYAVGCMLGRYSLDIEGLSYAGGDWDKAFENGGQP